MHPDNNHIWKHFKVPSCFYSPALSMVISFELALMGADDTDVDFFLSLVSACGMQDLIN